MNAGLTDPEGNPIPPKLDCGEGIPPKIPYFVILLVMVGTTFYQQRQMQKVAPPGATNPQQQALFKIMPLMFGIFGVSFPAGLISYWTTSNFWQIGQQHVMLRLGHIGPNARPTAPKPKSRTGLLGGLMARMDAQRRPAEGLGRRCRRKPGRRQVRLEGRGHRFEAGVAEEAVERQRQAHRLKLAEEARRKRCGKSKEAPKALMKPSRPPWLRWGPAETTSMWTSSRNPAADSFVVRARRPSSASE